ncbi:MAG: MarR family transcriptional regulator [Bacteroides sp.]|nr:MarR family transcriptional regulator [Bacteroides sp.]MCM1548972.1 MarR family transcriptional regulator [Clostridium sp.]
MNPQPGKELEMFNFLYKEMDDMYHDIAIRLGLSDSAFNILYTICILGDGCLQKDICNATYISKQTVNSSIKKLEQANILTLTSGKGRDMHLHLTEAGKELVKEKIFPIIEMENQTFSELPSKERQLLLELTEKYIRQLRKNTDGLFQPL